MQAILCNSGAAWRLHMQTSLRTRQLLKRHDLILTSIFYAAWVGGREQTLSLGWRYDLHTEGPALDHAGKASLARCDMQLFVRIVPVKLDLGEGSLFVVERRALILVERNGLAGFPMPARPRPAGGASRGENPQPGALCKPNAAHHGRSNHALRARWPRDIAASLASSVCRRRATAGSNSVLVVQPVRPATTCVHGEHRLAYSFCDAKMEAQLPARATARPRAAVLAASSGGPKAGGAWPPCPAAQRVVAGCAPPGG